MPGGYESTGYLQDSQGSTLVRCVSDGEHASWPRWKLHGSPSQRLSADAIFYCRKATVTADAGCTLEKKIFSLPQDNRASARLHMQWPSNAGTRQTAGRRVEERGSDLSYFTLLFCRACDDGATQTQPVDRLGGGRAGAGPGSRGKASWLIRGTASASQEQRRSCLGADRPPPPTGVNLRREKFSPVTLSGLRIFFVGRKKREDGGEYVLFACLLPR